MKRGQLSTELLVLIGLMMLLLVPLLIYAHGRANVATEDIAVQKAEFAAQRIASAADAVGYLGGEAAIVEELEMPSNLKKTYVSGNDIILEIDTSTGTKQIVKSSAFKLNSSGLDRITKSGTFFIQISALPPGSANQVTIELK